MVDVSAIPPGKPPTLYMVVIFAAIPEVTTEVQFLNFPMAAHSPEEAVERVQFVFTLSSYNPETKLWNLGGLPIIPWHICAVRYPKELEDLLIKELNLSHGTSEDDGNPATDTHGQIFQLFPKVPQKPDDPPPPPKE